MKRLTCRRLQRYGAGFRRSQYTLGFWRLWLLELCSDIAVSFIAVSAHSILVNSWSTIHAKHCVKKDLEED